jgi:2-haloalkanoic acid dehalogenase type II
MRPKLVNVEFRLTAPEVDFWIDVRLRSWGHRWLAVADIAGEPEIGLGRNARQAVEGALASLGQRTARAFLAEPSSLAAGVTSTRRRDRPLPSALVSSVRQVDRHDDPRGEFGAAPRAEALSFDLDGTLLDGSPWQEVIIRTCGEIAAAVPGLDARRLFEANVEVWERYFPEVEDKWALGILDGRAVTTEAWRRTLRACGVEDVASSQIAVDTYLRNRREALRLYDDVRALLNALARQVPLALVTNGASDTQRDALRALDIEREFSCIVISGEVGLLKPDPTIFRMALVKMGVGPEKVLHVGDSLTTDVAGAQGAGLTAVWLNRNGIRRESGDPEPDHEIRSLTELPALLGVDPG